MRQQKISKTCASVNSAGSLNHSYVSLPEGMLYPLTISQVCLSFAVSALMLIPWMDHVEVPRAAFESLNDMMEI